MWFVPWFVVCASVYIIHCRNGDISLKKFEEGLRGIGRHVSVLSINWMELLMSPNTKGSWLSSSQPSGRHGIRSVLCPTACTVKSVQQALYMFVEHIN